MSIWDSLGRAWRAFGRLMVWDDLAAKATLPDPRYFAGSGQIDDLPSLGVTGNQEGVYTWSSWVYTAVSRVAALSATMPFQVKQLIGERRVAVVNHPFELLLQHPNPIDSRYTLLEQVFSFLALTNNAYLWLNRADEGAEVNELFVIPSREIQPHPDGRMAIDGYAYYPDGQGMAPIYLPVWQVCHVKRFNPKSRFVGLSPVELASTAALTDRSMAQWNYQNFGKQNAKTPGVLSFPDPIADPIWKQMKAEFYGSDGTGATRQVILMRNTGNGTPKWIPTHLNQSEMQYLESRQFSKQEIYDLFAPGLAAMTAINATEANARTAKATLMEMTIWPTLVAVAEAITNNILPIYGDGLVGEFDDVRVTDRAMVIQEYAAYGPDQTINEQRKRQDLDPLEGMIFSGIPTRVLAQLDAGMIARLVRDALGIEDEEPEPEAPAPEPEEPEETPPGAAPTPPTEAPGEGDLSAPTPQEGMQDGAKAMLSPEARADLEKWQRKAIKRGKPCEFESDLIPGPFQAALKASLDAVGLSAFRFLKAAPDARMDAERALQETVAGVLTAWQVRMAQSIAARTPPDYAGLATDLQRGIAPELAAIATEVALREAGEVGIDFDIAAINIAALDWARGYTYELVKGLTETTRGVVERSIARFIETPGMTVGDLEALLEPAFGAVRARMISITEITRAYSAATSAYQAMLKEAGIEMEQVFNTSQDEKVCPVCWPLNGLPESAWGGGGPPPLHVSCRCFTSLRIAKAKR